MSFLQIKTGQFEGSYNQELIKFAFEPDEFQKHAFESIDSNSNVLITAHTGSGKTLVAIYAIAHCIKAGKRVIYTSPIKSLSNEKFKDFTERFGESFKEETGIDVSVGLLTGDNKINPEGNLLIMTAEILRNALYKISQNKIQTEISDNNTENINLIDNLGCIIMDEVHFINDPDRGKVWEETIVLAERDINLVMLSATIDKAEDFANWIGNIKKKNICLVPTSHRVVPLDHYIYVDNKLHHVFDTNDKYMQLNYIEAKKAHNEQNSNKLVKKNEHGEIVKIINKTPSNYIKVNYNKVPELVKYLNEKNMLQAIFFSFSRQNCESYAEKIIEPLVTHEEYTEAIKIWNKYLIRDEKKYEGLAQYNKVKKLLEVGVAFHHSGLIPILKEIIEILFAKGLIKILFATETFAVGVNMPTRTVVFTELEKYTNRGKRFLNTAEYKQMAGRAGRRGLDKTGTSIILPLYDFPDELDLRTVLTGKLPKIESKFEIDYQFVLKVLLSGFVTENENKLETFLNSTLMSKQDLNNISSLNQDLVKTTDQISLIKIDKESKEYKDLSLVIEVDAETQKFLKMGINYSPPKSKQKELQRIKKLMVQDKALTKLFENIQKLKDLETQKENILNSIENINNSNKVNIMKIANFLAEINYVDNDLSEIIFNSSFANEISKKIFEKGIVASQINECNPILLTEIIKNNIFDDLDPIHIVTLLSIFIKEGNTEEETYKSDIIKECDLEDKIDQIKKISEKLQDLEQKHFRTCNVDYWKTSLDYINSTFKWASSNSIQETMAYYPFKYEGNFIRNMIKLYNMTNELIKICHTINKITLIPKLEKIPELIIRDVVSLSSLYLGN